MKYTWRVLSVLILRITGILILLQLTRLFYFGYNYQSHFQDVHWKQYLTIARGGLRFDITAAVYLNALFIVLSVIPARFTRNNTYRKFLFWLFILTNSLGFTANIMDAFYYDFTLKRTTSEVFMFAGEGNIGILMLRFFRDYWYGFIILGGLIYALVVLYRYTERKMPHYNSPIPLFPGLGMMLLVMYFSVIGIRSGFTWATRPININLAGAYVKHPHQMPLVLNTPFTLIRTLNKQKFKPVHYFNNKEANKYFNPVKEYRDSLDFTKKNIVIIILESFAREYSGLLDSSIKNGEGYTPFLDSLMLKSHTFVNAYANGRQSIDAMPSILVSLPSLVQHYVLSPYITNDIRGLGNILYKEKGYYTAFIHGAPKGSMAFDAFTSLAGFEHYISGDDYPDKSQWDGHWGIYDEPFMIFAADKINQMPEPFAVTFFSLSSHHPFSLPAKYHDSFEKGSLPIHPTIRYTDMALKEFFDKARKMSWYKNTLFVITADHCNLSKLRAYHSSPLARFAVPLVFFDPSGETTPRLDSTLTQQADIMPRLLKLLHYQGKFVSFGNRPDNDKPINVQYINGAWQISDKDFILQVRDDKATALFRHKLGFTDKKNVIKQYPKQAASLEKSLKAYIQEYKNRLIYNKLTINKP